VKLYDTILITGCGGDIGLALGTIAAESGAANRLIGCDIYAEHPGGAVFDVCELVPPADAADYFPRLNQLADRYQVDAIVPMSEAEIGRFAEAGFLESFSGRTVITANRLAVETGLDKLETYRALKRAGLPAPWTVAVDEGDPLSLPCIVKPRRGQGGKGLQRVEAASAVREIAKTHPGYIWQELILPDEPEYTCGLYRSRTGEIRTIIFARRLRGGVTYSAEVVENETIDALLRAIARAVDLAGAINVQLRVDAEGPKVFEINPRFSSTVGFRHQLGFSDFLWSLQERRGMALAPYVPPRPGIRIFRGTSLLVIGA
jgi:carbamoyl-phosphate synthase large subunit